MNVYSSRPVLFAAILTLGLSAPVVEAQGCPGDCDGDGAVVVAELVRGVAISLGSLELSACPTFDLSDDGAVSVAEIVASVRSAIDGCAEDFLDVYAAVRAQAAGLSAQDLGEMYAQGPYVEDLEYAPADSAYLPEIAAFVEPSEAQLSVLEENGFVVLDDASYRTFELAYKRIYEADLPVFVSTDSILYALHRSYDAILQNLEQTVLIGQLGSMLAAMHEELGRMAAAGKIPPSRAEVARDADVYLAVARSLLAGEQVAPMGGSDAARITESIVADAAAELPTRLAIFGSSGTYDYSQMKPRGHYERIPTFQRYFRTMIWLGRTEMAMVELPGGAPRFNRAAFDAAFLMHLLLRESGARLHWDRINLALERMVGERDSMDPRDMEAFAAANGLVDFADLENASDAWLQNALLASPYGLQRIMSQIIFTDPNAPVFVLPRVFLLLGQRFVIDSYVFHHVTYDRLIDPSSGRKLTRMLPSELDVMFALGANAAVPLLAEELSRHPYQGTLHELRFLIDAHPRAFWEANLYNGWLDALRALNDDLQRPERPAAMRTEAWARKTLETQLASWAELRHDTILYTKQSYSSGITCTYPDAYLEPAPRFFEQMAALAQLGVEMTEVLGASGFEVDRVSSYFERLGEVMLRLRRIADKELAGDLLTGEEIDYLRMTIEEEIVGCGELHYDGWYPSLFFDRSDVAHFEPTIADIHTAPTDAAGTPVGWVLHAATGKANLMIFTQNDCGAAKAYIGPVSTYHSVLTTGFQRRTDSEWETMVEEGQASPEWTSVYRR